MNRRDFLRVLGLGGAGAVLAACGQGLPEYSDLQTERLRSLVLLYTNDEHGWMEPQAPNGGAAGMFKRWQRQAGYSTDEPYLVLSGGDSWTGPAISTWFKGESMVDVMNAMGYAAAAIGNHDFDFGEETLYQRAAQAKFPFLCANLRRKDTGEIPGYVQPFAIQEINGVSLGLIGLANLETVVDTNPSNVAGLDFLPYDDSLRQVVPQVKAAGAQLLVVVGHLCTGDVRALVPSASELGIHVLCAGHCHEEIVEQVGNVTIMQAGSFLGSYVRMAMLFDTVENRLEMTDTRLLPNPKGGEDEEISELVQSWYQRADPSLWENIGYAGRKIDALSPEMARLLTRPWLESIPAARIALFSPRYVQSLPEGEITPGAILGMIPTDNELVDMQLTGSQVIEIIEAHHPGVGGIHQTDGGYFMDDGTPLNMGSSYHVLIPDGLYEGENYYAVKDYDPFARYTGVGWRTPVEQWVRNLQTSSRTPLEDYLTEE